MRKFIAIVLLLLPGQVLNSCKGKSQGGVNPKDDYPAPLPGYEWTKLANEADFPKSYNFQLFSIQDTLWAFHSAGNWYSLDGKTWTRSTLPNAINNLAFLDYVYFNDAVYGLGHFEGNIEKYTLTTPVYRTTDMKTWTTLSKESNLPRRFFYHPFVFQNKIWIIGGDDGVRQYADAWNSDDGVNWKKVADNLPFGKVQSTQFVLFHDRIFMISNDVWSSADGINWVRETDEIVKEQQITGNAIVFDNKIWMLGCNRNNVFKSEVLVSDDAKTWIAQRAPWSPRGGVAACVHHGQIVMTGGKYGGPGIAGQTEFIYSNDVWTFRKKLETEK